MARLRNCVLPVWQAWSEMWLLREPYFPIDPASIICMGSNDALALFFTVILCWLIVSSFNAAIVILRGVHQNGTIYAQDSSTVSGLT